MKVARRTRKLSCGAMFMIFAIALGAVTDRVWATNVIEINSGRPNLTVLLVEGAIQSGDTLALEGAVGRLPPRKSVAVILNSPGGDLDEGMKLGRFFYRARIATFVLGHGGGCYSACAIAFLGGRSHDGRPSRTKMTGGNLGFHQFRRNRSAAGDTIKYTKADMERELFTTRAIALNIIYYLSDIGEDMSILHLMLKAPAAEVTLLNNEDAVTYGIHVMDERNDQVIDATSIKARIDSR